MEKFFKLIFCAVLTIIGTVGVCVEIHRLWEFRQAMTDEQWVGEILLIVVYAGAAGLGIFRAISLWREKY